MEDNKYISCKDLECVYNKDGLCTKVTEKDLENRKTCGERKF